MYVRCLATGDITGRYVLYLELSPVKFNLCKIEDGYFCIQSPWRSLACQLPFSYRSLSLVIYSLRKPPVYRWAIHNLKSTYEVSIYNTSLRRTCSDYDVSRFRPFYQLKTLIKLMFGIHGRRDLQMALNSTNISSMTRLHHPLPSLASSSTHGFLVYYHLLNLKSNQWLHNSSERQLY